MVDQIIIPVLLAFAAGCIFFSFWFFGRGKRKPGGEDLAFLLERASALARQQEMALHVREDRLGAHSKRVVDAKLEEWEQSEDLLMLDPVIRKLSLLKKLQESGLITPQDYAERKKDILDEV